MVEHHAGLPLRMKPRSGKSREAPAFGPISQEHMAPWHTTDGTTARVAESALAREDNRQQRSETRLKGSTRVPATVSEAQAALTPTDPPTMAPRLDGDRDRALTSPEGGVAHRWGRIASEPRLPQAPRTVDTPWRKHRAQDVNAGKHLCRTACAGAADAPQALSPCAHGLQATLLAPRTVRSTPRDGQRGRPGADTQPAQVVSLIEGALASRLATRQALVDRQRCVLWATTALDAPQLPPQALLAGDQGQGHAARGVRFRKEPRFRAASRSLNKPERRMALWRVMTVCGLV
jgi:hypothetical protein